MPSILNRRHLLRILGPGMLFAGAAIGGSHLIQSTRAGANYGFKLIALVILINIIKYPFFEFGQRYTAITQKNLLTGYAKLGSWILMLYILLTIVTALPTMAAVSFITANIATYMISTSLSPLTFSIAILSVCATILFIGHYIWLERTVKLILIILAVSTFITFIVALPKGIGQALAAPSPSIWHLSGFAFMIALMGWMPAPIEVSVWTSLWTCRRNRYTEEPANLKDTLLDFRIGYIGSAILALLFLSLGAFVMFGSGESFADSGIIFSHQLITLYSSHIGDWTQPFITIAAFTTMFSTTITCLDAYPRAIATATKLVLPPTAKFYPLMYWYWVLILFFVSIILSGYFVHHMKALVDLATTIAFFTAPIFGYMNYRVITHKNITPLNQQPPRGMIILSRFSLVFLVLVSGVYAIWNWYA